MNADNPGAANNPGADPSKISMADFFTPAGSGKVRFITANVNMHPAIWKRMKIMAIVEECSLTSLVNEALAVYIKWLKKAEKLESSEERQAELDRQISVQESIIREIQFRRDKDNKSLLRYHKMKNKMPKVRRFPGMLRKPKVVERLIGI